MGIRFKPQSLTLAWKRLHSVDELHKPARSSAATRLRSYARRKNETNNVKSSLTRAKKMLHTQITQLLQDYSEVTQKNYKQIQIENSTDVPQIRSTARVEPTTVVVSKLLRRRLGKRSMGPPPGWRSGDLRKAAGRKWIRKAKRTGLSGVYWERPMSNSGLMRADDDSLNPIFFKQPQ